jgi:hypothetical protein
MPRGHRVGGTIHETRGALVPAAPRERNPMLKDLILTVLLAWGPRPAPTSEPGETVAEYWERAETYAAAYADVSDSPEEAAAVMATQKAETNLDPFVHRGVPHPEPWMHLDHGLARCNGSIRRVALKPEWGLRWEELAGTSYAATRRCAQATLLILRRNARYCGVSLDTREGFARASRLYLTGHSCDPCPESRRRAAHWAALVARLKTKARNGS